LEKRYSTSGLFERNNGSVLNIQYPILNKNTVLIVLKSMSLLKQVYHLYLLTVCFIKYG